MDCSLPSSSVHGIFQAPVLEWIAISFSRGFSWPRDWTRVSYIAGRCFTVLVTREATKPYKQGAGKDWRQEEKEVTEGEIAGWHHQLNGHEFEQTPGDSEGQRSLSCCRPRNRKGSDTTEDSTTRITLAHATPVSAGLWEQSPPTISTHYLMGLKKVRPFSLIKAS